MRSTLVVSCGYERAYVVSRQRKRKIYRCSAPAKGDSETVARRWLPQIGEKRSSGGNYNRRCFCYCIQSREEDLDCEPSYIAYARYSLSEHLPEPGALPPFVVDVCSCVVSESQVTSNLASVSGHFLTRDRYELLVTCSLLSSISR